VATIKDITEESAPQKREVIAESGPMRDVLNFVRRVAASEATTILLEGENGTGKDLVAKTLHYQSLSCHRFRSNEVRLWLSVLAYNLGNLWRRLVLPNRIEKWSLSSLQQRLAKTGGRLVKHAWVAPREREGAES